MNIIFEVDGQIIKRVNIRDQVVADSINLIGLSFTFSSEWDGVTKTAVITTGGTTYNIVMENDAVDPTRMPILQAGVASFSVYGGDLVTANESLVPIEKSGYKIGDSPLALTDKMYDQFVEEVKTERVAAEGYSQAASKSATEAGISVDAADRSAKAANDSAGEAAGSAKAATEAANLIIGNVEAAQKSASDAAASALLTAIEVSEHNASRAAHADIRSDLTGKVDKDGTKVLSTNDYTTTDMELVATIKDLASAPDLQAVTELINNHKNGLVMSADGSHGLRYNGGLLQYKASAESVWETIPIGAGTGLTTAEQALLESIADKLASDGKNFAEEIDAKVTAVVGKGLSTNDFTNEYKQKVDNAGTGGGLTEVTTSDLDWESTNGSANLFNYQTTSKFPLKPNGTLDTTVIGSAETSDYIAVKGNTTYMFPLWIASLNWSNVSFYDSNKTFISSIVGDGTTTIYAGSGGISKTTPSNACYMRYCSWSTLFGANWAKSAMIVEGNALPTTYVPYGTNSIDYNDVNCTELMTLHKEIGDTVSKFDKIDQCKYPLVPVWGHEYLNSWYKKLYYNSSVKMLWTGDSTTAEKDSFGDYRRCKIVGNIMRVGGYDMSKVKIGNNGIGSTTSGSWIGISDCNSYVANGMLDNDMKPVASDDPPIPDILFVGFGINDYTYRDTFNEAGVVTASALTLKQKLDYFASYMEEGLKRIRGSAAQPTGPAYNRGPDDLAIVLIMPTTVEARRDNWLVYVRQVLQTLARKYQCAFVDPCYRQYDRSFGNAWCNDFTAIHSAPWTNGDWVSMMADLVYPLGLQKGVAPADLALKVDKVTGKGLSTIDVSDAKSVPYKGTVIPNASNVSDALDLAYANGGGSGTVSDAKDVPYTGTTISGAKNVSDALDLTYAHAGGSGTSDVINVYNAKNYGVIGDGSTDDYTAINGLITTVFNAGGGTIYLPKGVYAIGNTLIWKSHVSLVGDGVGKSILKPTGLFAAIGYADSAYSAASPLLNCNFSNFEINGDNVVSTVASSVPMGITLTYIKNCLFERLLIRNMIGSGLSVYYPDNLVIDKVTTTNCGYNWTDDGNWGPAGQTGITVGIGGMSNENYVITNCFCIGCGHYGILIEDQGKAPDAFQSNLISKCTIRGGKWDGIGVKGGKYVNITGNIVYGNAHNGIAISHGAVDVNIASNISKGNGKDAVGIIDSQTVNTNIKVASDNLFSFSHGQAYFNKVLSHNYQAPSNVGQITGTGAMVVYTKFRLSDVSSTTHTLIARNDTNYSAGFASGWALRILGGVLKLEAYLTNGGTQINRIGTTVLQVGVTYYVKIVYDGATFSILLSTNGVDYTAETFITSTGTDADLRACFALSTAMSTYIGKQWVGNGGFGYYLYGYMYQLKVWKTTTDTSTRPTMDFEFNNFGANQTAIEEINSSNGVPSSGITQSFCTL